MIQFKMVSFPASNCLQQLPTTDLILNYREVVGSLTSRDVHKFPPSDVVVNFYIALTIHRLFIQKDNISVCFIIRHTSAGDIQNIVKNIRDIGNVYNKKSTFCLKNVA